MTDYQLLQEELKSIAEEDPWFVPLFSNASALLFESVGDLNWAGFYLERDGRLVLGPFQGKPACIHIRPGKGVCGTAFSENRTVRVANVHEFSGHIACDGASNSEIVIPLRQNGRVFGVLDLDSPSFSRFTEEDERGLEAFAETLGQIVRL